MRITKNNYYSQRANWEYLGFSQYKDFMGSMGQCGCEARALARLKGEWQEEPTAAMLIGSYVDSWFEGTLDKFKEENSDIFKKDGSLKSEFVQAEEVIERVKRDPLFMLYMSGQKQKIMTSELFGAKWKIKMDSYHKNDCIVDLKVVKDIHERKWVKDYGNCTFVDYWGYDLQGAIYQAIVKQKTGKTLPFYLCVADKQNVIDYEVVQIPNQQLKEALFEIECNVKRILDIKQGLIEPDRCGKCDYCKSTKILKAPIHYTELIEI